MQHSFPTRRSSDLANMLKFADGGWVPVLLAIALFALMRIWQTGSAAVQALANEPQIPIADIVAQIDSGEIRRVPGTAVFVARITREIDRKSTRLNSSH